MTTRISGILLHPTALPGPHGIGDLGASSLAFIDFLVQSGQRCWQVLPLGPTGYGDSPYQPLSAFAGNPLLISLDRLAADGLLSSGDLASQQRPPERIDFSWVQDFKIRQLRAAFANFQRRPPSWASELRDFCTRQAHWLDDFALFLALKETQRGAPWYRWPRSLAQRSPEALREARSRLAEDMAFHQFTQFVFSRQWCALREYAGQQSVSLVGDLPIFVAYDSADVWSHPEIFDLDANGGLVSVAGVPPDYFSPTGQRWGNPTYRWDILARTRYSWWIDRFRRGCELTDLVRIDHFRGFASFWKIPSQEPTAIHGTWVPGPGRELFLQAQAELGALPILAEDLGLITPDVLALRDSLGYPGMRVLQFAFDGDPNNPHLPPNYEANCVVYTGTHDNDTLVSWYATRTVSERDRIRSYLGTVSSEPHWDLIRCALASVAKLAIFPLQDILSLGNDSRFNTPGNPVGNWTWRFHAAQLSPSVADRLRTLTELCGRGSEKLSNFQNQCRRSS